MNWPAVLPALLGTLPGGVVSLVSTVLVSTLQHRRSLRIARADRLRQAYAAWANAFTDYQRDLEWVRLDAFMKDLASAAHLGD